MRKPSLHNKQNGQAILLIAVLMVSLIAALGLAIDGGGMFLMYRDVQNATDAAGLSAAFALCTGDNPEDAARRSAALNGFEHGVDFATVVVENPPTTGSRAGDPLFISVTITDNKPAYFIQVVYDGPLQVSATTISRCDPGSDFGFPENSALVSLRQECGSGGGTPNYGIRNSGNSALTIVGGVFVNQDDATGGGCQNDSSIDVAGSGVFSVTGEVCTRGNIDYSGGNAYIYNADFSGEADILADSVDGDSINYSQCDIPAVTNPEPLDIGTPGEGEICPDDQLAGLPTNSDPNDTDPRTTWAQPGRYNSFSNGPNDVTYLEPGIYCVTGDIDIKGTLVGEGVFIYQSCSAIPNNANCDFSFNAGAELDLSGMTSGDYQNLTFYSRSENTGNPGNKFRGSASMQMAGTFYAPYAHCDLAGGTNSTFLAQFICYTSDFIGGGETVIQYNPNTVYRNPATFGIDE